MSQAPSRNLESRSTFANSLLSPATSDTRQGIASVIFPSFKASRSGKPTRATSRTVSASSSILCTYQKRLPNHRIFLLSNQQHETRTLSPVPQGKSLILSHNHLLQKLFNSLFTLILPFDPTRSSLVAQAFRKP
jgi:hypothetical protein